MYASTGYKEKLHAAVAAALGISAVELETAFAEGRTIRYLAEEKDADLTSVRSAVSQVHQDQIRQALDAGELSPEQAEFLLKWIDFSPRSRVETP